MLTKFKNHCGRPITWGAYYKMCGVCYIAAIIIVLTPLIANAIDDLKYKLMWKKIEREYGNEEDES